MIPNSFNLTNFIVITDHEYRLSSVSQLPFVQCIDYRDFSFKILLLIYALSVCSQIKMAYKYMCINTMWHYFNYYYFPLFKKDN